MSQITIRPASVIDLSSLMAMDHSCQTDYVWQMDVQGEEGQFGAIFRLIRLPRTVSINYPRDIENMPEEWDKRLGMHVAWFDGEIVGFIRINDLIIPRTAWITDLVVAPESRRHGIATSLIESSYSWALERNNDFALLEMTSKNYPAINLAKKMGFEFCGYNDRYYRSKDIALFFGRSI
jgi:ribosomal protein S18 acetylase RimI-like enzyme